MGCRLWGRTESDTTDATQQQQQQQQQQQLVISDRRQIFLGGIVQEIIDMYYIQTELQVQRSCKK